MEIFVYGKTTRRNVVEQHVSSPARVQIIRDATGFVTLRAANIEVSLTTQDLDRIAADCLRFHRLEEGAEL